MRKDKLQLEGEKYTKRGQYITSQTSIFFNTDILLEPSTSMPPLRVENLNDVQSAGCFQHVYFCISQNKGVVHVLKRVTDTREESQPPSPRQHDQINCKMGIYSKFLTNLPSRCRCSLFSILFPFKNCVQSAQLN